MRNEGGRGEMNAKKFFKGLFGKEWEGRKREGSEAEGFRLSGLGARQSPVTAFAAPPSFKRGLSYPE